MKYGSTVKIEVSELWSPKPPLFSRQLTIANNQTSRDALEEIKRGLSSWFNTAVRITSITKELSDDEVLALAKSRGLISDEVNLSELYYVESRSGKTGGHFIERFRNGAVSCTCPGYVNNGKCWASTGVSTSPDQYLRHKWSATRELFNTYRKNEYGK